MLEIAKLEDVNLGDGQNGNISDMQETLKDIPKNTQTFAINTDGIDRR